MWPASLCHHPTLHTWDFFHDQPGVSVVSPLFVCFFPFDCAILHYKVKMTAGRGGMAMQMALGGGGAQARANGKGRSIGDLGSWPPRFRGSFLFPWQHGWAAASAMFCNGPSLIGGSCRLDSVFGTRGSRVPWGKGIVEMVSTFYLYVCGLCTDMRIGGKRLRGEGRRA